MRGNADVPVCRALGANFYSSLRSQILLARIFALMADEDVRTPGKIKLPNSETASPLFNCFENQLPQYLCMFNLDLDLSCVAGELEVK